MKTLVLILIIAFLLFPIISAVEFNMSSEFQKGETFFAKISGNFIEPVLKENIDFYRGHVRVTIEPFVTKINEEFYIYARLPETENNYSIVVSGIKYMSGSQIDETNLTQNFTITNQTVQFSVDKGFVVSNEDFFLEVQNLQDTSITIDISQQTISGDTGDFAVGESITLKSGDIEKINFAIGELTESTLKTITLNSGELSYEILVNIYEIGREAKQKATEDKDFIDLDEEEEEEIIVIEEYVSTTTATCEELNGTVCGSNEECNGQSENAKDAPCCLGTCTEIPTSSTGKIIGWIIVVAIIAFLAWFFKFKYRGTKREVNLLDVGAGKKSKMSKDDKNSALSKLDDFKKKFSGG